ncbi:unnamed protein product, partial [Ixodes pacificus]
VRGDGLEPVVVEVEEHHLRFGGLQDEVSKLLHLQAGLEGQLQLTALNHNVGEVQQCYGAAYLQWIEHALSGDNDLLGLLLHGQGTNQGCHLLSCFPLGQLDNASVRPRLTCG